MVRGDVFSAADFAKSAAEFLFSVVLFSESAAESAPPAVGLPENGVYAPDFPAPAAVPWAVSVRFREAKTPFLRGFPRQVLGKFRKKSPNTVHPVPFFVPAAATFGGKCCFYPSEWWHSYPKKVKKKEKFWQKNVFVLLLQPLSGVYHPFLPGGAEIIPLYLNRVMPA